MTELSKEMIDSKIEEVMAGSKPLALDAKSTDAVDATPKSPTDAVKPVEELPESSVVATSDTEVTGTLVYGRIWSKSGKLISADDSEELITIPKVPNVPLASVGYSSGMTLNLGDYESVKIGVSVTLPSPLAEIEEAFKVAKDFVDRRLGTEVGLVKSYRAKRGEAS